MLFRCLPDHADAGLPQPESCADIAAYTEALRTAAARAIERIAGARRQRAALSAKLLAYINDNLGAPISEDSAAEHCGISAGYAGKLVKEETGESWVDYLNKRRLETALELLRDPGIKVEAAARGAGFNSAAYFIKRFKERYGLTPQAWRRRFFSRC